MSQHTSINKGVASSAQKPAGKAKTPISPRALAIGGGVLIVLLGIAGIIYWATRPMEIPPVNAPALKVLRFVDSEEFKKQPWDRRALYLKVLDTDERRQELKAARDSGALDQKQYTAALSYAWFGKHLDRMEKYTEMKDTQRDSYLKKKAEEEVVEDHLRRNPTSRPKDWVAKSPDEVRDKAMDAIYPLTWPTEVRLQWRDYHRALTRAERQVRRTANIGDLIRREYAPKPPAGAPKPAASSKPSTGR